MSNCLNQPYYIEHRNNGVDLNGEWEFCWEDSPVKNRSELDFNYRTVLPKSLFHSVNEAGILPDPYFGTNSKLYDWVDKKVWYYRKKIYIPADASDKKAILCFDGVAYYCNLFVNGVDCGNHEGMFGGPVCDITDKLIYEAENEILLEVKASNYPQSDMEEQEDKGYIKSPIIPWNINRDVDTSNGDFIVVGIWNNIRLEFLEPIHISRPYLYTDSISDGTAILNFEMQISDGTLTELKKYYGYNDGCYRYTMAYNNGVTGAVSDKEVKIVIKITEPDTGNVAYQSEDIEPLLDYDNSQINPNYYELQFFSKKISIDNARLWYPHGMGEPYLYNVMVQLYFEDKLCDSYEFKTGIKTFSSSYTHGRKYRHRWEEFLFSINGKETFIKGINWMPIDFLYDINPDEYEWCLTLAKNAGIQMLRVWNGGGFPETNTFYELCDKLGIMVWQDLLIANADDTSNYAQDLLESQIAYNLYRIRNHSSLVVLCGGNEFNPYRLQNAASMFVETRVCKDLAPHIIYHYTTCDKGSAHVYKDFDPAWFRKTFKDLPFLAEAGIHCMPSYSTWKKLLSKAELNAKMPDLTTEEFQKGFPELLNHFTEYVPERVPRMLSRASQITNLKEVQLAELCEATQVQSYEFYTIMIQSIRENFPVCGGIMPWVFKRHWATVGIQVVDGTGQPLYPYYAVQNTYKDLQIMWKMPYTVVPPKATLPLDTELINDSGSSMIGTEIQFTIYNPDLTLAKEYRRGITNNEHSYSFGEFTLDDSFTDTCLLIDVKLIKDGIKIANTTYWIKCTSALADQEYFCNYSKNISGNLYFENGPWLKENIMSAKKSDIRFDLLRTGSVGKYSYYDISIENNSKIPAFPVTVHLKNDEVRHFESENFFLLSPNERRIVRITTESTEKLSSSDIKVCAWNARD